MVTPEKKSLLDTKHQHMYYIINSNHCAERVTIKLGFTIFI